MNIFAIGDLHLALDERIEKDMSIFGPRWENHAERLRQSWLSLVKEEDLVLIPGDISWGLRLEESLVDFAWIHALPGKKIITKGNHDLWWCSMTKMNGMYEDIDFLQNFCYPVPGTKIGICGSRGWICPGGIAFDEHDEKIYQRELVRLEMSLKDAEQKGVEEIIAMLHFPPTNDKLQRSGFTEMLERYPVKTCIYGHLHGSESWGHGLQGVMNGIEYRLVAFDYLDAQLLKLR